MVLNSATLHLHVLLILMLVYEWNPVLKISKAGRSGPCISPRMYDKLDHPQALTVWKVTKQQSGLYLSVFSVQVQLYLQQQFSCHTILPAIISYSCNWKLRGPWGWLYNSNTTQKAFPTLLRHLLVQCFWAVSSLGWSNSSQMYWMTLPLPFPLLIKTCWSLSQMLWYSKWKSCSESSKQLFFWMIWSFLTFIFLISVPSKAR